MHSVYLRSDTSSVTSRCADNLRLRQTPVCGLTPHRGNGHPSCLSNVGTRFRVIANDRLRLLRVAARSFASRRLSMQETDPLLQAIIDRAPSALIHTRGEVCLSRRVTAHENDPASVLWDRMIVLLRILTGSKGV